MGKRYTVAVDFDGVLHSYTSPWAGAHRIPDPPVDGAIEWLWRTIQKFDVVILTTRGKWFWGRWAVRRWLHKHAGEGLWYEQMGTRGLEDVKVSATKEAALIYLDDRAYRFDGTNFPTPEQIHAARPWNKQIARSTPGRRSA